MPSSNAEVAELLRRYAAALVFEGADRFKVKAYRRAADTVESHGRPVKEMIAKGEDLTKLTGVGKAISEKIADIVKTGKLRQLDRSMSNLKPELVEFASKPSLDPKVVLRAYKKLNINTLDELKKRLASGEVKAALGARIDYQIRQGLQERRRMLLYDAEPIASKIEQYLSSLPGVEQVSRVGSLRRKQETVGDLSFLVASQQPDHIFKAFARFPGAKLVSSEGDAANFRLSSGPTVKLHSISHDQWGLGLILHTGSTKHVEQLQSRARSKRLQLTPSSLTKKKIDLADETVMYQSLGLKFIVPELREGRGEITAASKGKMSELVDYEDLRGDLHMHTTASDGANTIAQMLAAAQERGYEYIAITDHSQSLKITNGLTEKRLLQQIRAIDKLNERLTNFVVLKSAEVDILEDGKLDYPNAVLKQLDLTICSIHSRFALNKEQQTQRILRAMDNRYFNILGHATGRLLLKRQGYELDVERITEHAKSVGCFFEINSSPDRLDLSDEHAKLAKDAGIKIAVNTDAHSIAELEFIHAGLNQARRAWLQPNDVLNTLSWPKLKKLLKR